MDPMLAVPNKVVIAFFTAVVIGLATAVVALWKNCPCKCPCCQ